MAPMKKVLVADMFITAATWKNFSKVVRNRDGSGGVPLLLGPGSVWGCFHVLLNSLHGQLFWLAPSLFTQRLFNFETSTYLYNTHHKGTVGIEQRLSEPPWSRLITQTRLLAREPQDICFAQLS